MLYNGYTDLRLIVFSQTSIILQIYHLQHHPQIFIRRVHETQVNHAKSWIDFEPWALQYSSVILCTCRYLKYMYSGPTLMFVYLSVWMIWWNRYSLPGEISDVVFFLQNCSRFLWPSSTIVILPDHHPEHVNVTPPPLIHNSECWLFWPSCLRLDNADFRGLMLERHML